MEFEKIFELALQALSGPAAAFVLLAIVLYGAWVLANRLLTTLSAHLTAIAEKFDKFINTIDIRLKNIEDTVTEVYSTSLTSKRTSKKILQKMNEKES